MKHHFLVINRNNLETKSFPTAEAASIYLLGRTIKEYMVIKAERIVISELHSNDILDPTYGRLSNWREWQRAKAEIEKELQEA